jgi:hypothetical protein
LAKGKRSSGKHYVSKGEVGYNRAVKKQQRREWVGSVSQDIAKWNAFIAGKNVMVTIPNPNKHETNKRFIRVNARDVWKRRSG